jgi:hypothetical protein
MAGNRPRKKKQPIGRSRKISLTPHGMRKFKAQMLASYTGKFDFFFEQKWKALAKKSHCDGFGGAECCRVYREWVQAGRPAGINEFILRRANIGPRDKGA